MASHACIDKPFLSKRDLPDQDTGSAAGYLRVRSIESKAFLGHYHDYALRNP
jgi:hypothetical protein